MSAKSPAAEAGLLFAGGPILTMTEPGRVEALAVRGDRIAAAGSLAMCRDAPGSPCA